VSLASARRFAASRSPSASRVSRSRARPALVPVGGRDPGATRRRPLGEPGWRGGQVRVLGPSHPHVITQADPRRRPHRDRPAVAARRPDRRARVVDFWLALLLEGPHPASSGVVDENVVASTSTALQANATNEATASAHAATVNPEDARGGRPRRAHLVPRPPQPIEPGIPVSLELRRSKGLIGGTRRLPLSRRTSELALRVATVAPDHADESEDRPAIRAHF